MRALGQLTNIALNVRLESGLTLSQFVTSAAAAALMIGVAFLVGTAASEELLVWVKDLL